MRMTAEKSQRGSLAQRRGGRTVTRSRRSEGLALDDAALELGDLGVGSSDEHNRREEGQKSGGSHGYGVDLKEEVDREERDERSVASPPR